ncbi:MAG: 2OG-Fe(II) oxygenase [Hyphomonadaceae bacterium]
MIELTRLRDYAQAGDIGAQVMLARRLLVGEGVQAMPQQALQLYRAAAEGGSGEAAFMLAIFAARGVLQPRNFERAAQFLQIAASYGWARAGQELALLARGTRHIDFEALTRPPEAEILSDSPRVVALRGFATPEECNWIIGCGRDHLRRARVYQGADALVKSDVRTNSEADFTIFNTDVLLGVVRMRMERATGAPDSHFEVAKLLHYQPGQTFALHADYFEGEGLAGELEKRGQRVMTLLLYLNEDYEGGETDFPEVGVRFKGAVGDALLFTNADAAGEPDRRTLHAGLPPASGEKWLLSQWIRSKPVAP